MGFIVVVLLSIGAVAWVLAPMVFGDGETRRLPRDVEPRALPEAGEDDQAELLVSEWRREVVCPACGKRAEPAASFCSTCGRDLRDARRGPS